MTHVELACLVGAVLAVALGTHHWRRRSRAELAGPLAVVMFTGAAWSVLQLVVVWTDSSAVRTAAVYAILPAAATLAAATLVYTLVLLGHGARVTRRLLTLMSLHPVLLLLVATTDPSWGLVLAEVSSLPDGGLALAFGPVFWLHTAYSYGLITLSAGLMVRALARAVKGHRTLLLVALLGMLLPLVGNAVFLAFSAPGQVEMDLAPVLFLGTAAIWSWAAWFRNRLEALPISTRDVLRSFGDGVVVVDADGVVLDLNPAAHALLTRLAPPGRHAAGHLLGRRWDSLVGEELAAVLLGASQQLITLRDGTVVDVRVERLTTASGRSRGAVVVARDVTELERLRGELSELAVRDGLTGLFNRRHLTEVLGHALTAADTSDAPLAVVMLDVDRFKDVNDSHGHAVGDEVLVQLSGLLTAAARPGDVVARTGGEAFVVLMPGTTVDQAAAWAERLVQRCRTHPLVTEAGSLGVTASLGVAGRWAGEPAGGLLGRADRALYAAKAAGRDRAEVAPPPDAVLAPVLARVPAGATDEVPAPR